MKTSNISAGRQFTCLENHHQFKVIEMMQNFSSCAPQVLILYFMKHLDIEIKLNVEITINIDDHDPTPHDTDFVRLLL